VEENGFFKHISIARFASRTLDHELEKNTRTVIPYFGSTFILMAFFRFVDYLKSSLNVSRFSPCLSFSLRRLRTNSVITCMMGDTVRSKPWLGLLGNISACMSTAAAFGLAMYLGVEFIGINLAAPFLMIGEFELLIGFKAKSLNHFESVKKECKLIVAASTIN
jgi:patched domain-containing protein